MNSVKLRLAVFALAACLAGAVTGSLAYTDFSQQAVNEFEGGRAPGVRLHDDYTEVYGAVWSNKDVYAENYGSLPQFLRIQFAEFMSIESASLVDEADVNDPASWHVHLPADVNGDGVVDPVSGASDPFHVHWSWVLGNAATSEPKLYLPTDNHADTGAASAQADDALAADYAYAALIAAGGVSDEWEEADLGYLAADDPATDVDETTLPHNSYGQGVARTAAPAPVITMDEWLKNPRTGPFWVWDADGWVYWAEPLHRGTATGVLMDAVSLDYEPEATAYYYAIHVRLEAITADEMTDGHWFAQDGDPGGERISANAQTLLTLAKATLS